MTAGSGGGDNFIAPFSRKYIHLILMFILSMSSYVYKDAVAALFNINLCKTQDCLERRYVEIDLLACKMVKNFDARIRLIDVINVEKTH